MSATFHGERCYRIAGYYGGMEQHSIWYSSLAQAERAYKRVKRRGEWAELAIERTDGKVKAGPRADEWVEPGDGLEASA